MRKHLVLVLAVGAAAALGGCVDVEESVSLRRDLSGTADFSMTVDLEPMFAFQAGMQHRMLGKAGDPTAAEIDQARKESLEGLNKDPTRKQQETAAAKAQLEQGLPPGVRLLSNSFDLQGTKVVLRCQFGFVDVQRLAKVKWFEGRWERPGQNPWSYPFATLQLVDEGRTLLVTVSGAAAEARLQETAAEGAPRLEAGPPATPEMSKALAGAFKTARFAFRLDSPFEVVETNAIRRDGRTLYWEVTAADPNAKVPQTLTARLEK